MNLLVVGPTWVGDTVLATPLLANLRAAFPQARLYYLATAWAAGVLRGHPDIDDLRIRPARPAGDWQAALALRRENVEWAFILPNSIRGALLALAAGARRRTGYARNARALLLTEPVPYRQRPVRHQSEEYLDLLKAAGVPVTVYNPSLAVSEEAKAFAEEALREAGVGPGEPVVGIQPGAKFGATKLWPAERFAAVGDRLAREEGARVVLLGGAGEVPLTTRIAATMTSDAVNLAGKDDLSHLPGLLRRLTVLLTGDTGPMHVAAAVGTPVVALFGPTDPIRTGPLGRGHEVLRRDLFCSPCFRKRCPYGHECMEDIGVEEVLRAVRERLRVCASTQAGARRGRG